MNMPHVSQIEESIYKLSMDEQRWLYNRLSQHIHNSKSVNDEIAVQLTEMANDPEIQNELQMIETEFAVTEADGLKNE